MDLLNKYFADSVAALSPEERTALPDITTWSSFSSDLDKLRLAYAIAQGRGPNQLIAEHKALKRVANAVRAESKVICDKFANETGAKPYVRWVWGSVDNDFPCTQDMHVQNARSKFWTGYDCQVHNEVTITGYTYSLTKGGTYPIEMLHDLMSGKHISVLSEPRGGNVVLKPARVTLITTAHPSKLLGHLFSVIEKLVDEIKSNLTLDDEPDKVKPATKAPTTKTPARPRCVKSTTLDPACDGYSTRKEMIDYMCKTMPETKAVELEYHLLHKATNRLPTTPSWNYPPFVAIYKNTVRYNIDLLTSTCGDPAFLKGYLDGTLSANAISDLQDTDMYPEKWQQILDTERAAVASQAGGFRTITTMETCRKCNSKRVYCDEAQTRCADEPTTQFFECCECGTRWRRC